MCCVPAPSATSSGEATDFLRIELRFAAPGCPPVTAAAAYTRDGERRLTADGADLPDPSRWRELVPVRTFIPDDLRLIKGSPRRRREYLDALAGNRRSRVQGCAQGVRGSAGAAKRPSAQPPSGSDDRQFGPWETMLAQTGALVSRRRADRLQDFIDTFQHTYGDLTR